MDVAATISAQPPSRRNGGSDPTAGQFVFGGGNPGEIKRAAALNAGGTRRRLDFESETFVVSRDSVPKTAGGLVTDLRAGNPHISAVVVGDPFVFESRIARCGRGVPDDIVPALKTQSGGTGKGDGAPLVVNAFNGYTGGADDNDAETGHVVAVALNSGGNNGGFRTEPDEHLVVGPLAAHSSRHGHAMTTQQAVDAAQIIPFDTTQLTSWANYSSPKPGDPSHPLAANADAPAIAFTWQGGIESRTNPSVTGTDALQANTVPAVLDLSQTVRGGPRNADAPAIAFNWQSGGDNRVNPSETGIDALSANQTPAVFTMHETRQDAVAVVGFQSSQSGVREVDQHATLDSNNGSRRHNGVIQNGVRRLTPTECCRLQGFPDDWNAVDADDNPLSNSARYRQLGNAVAVPVVYWIGRRIVACVLERQSRSGVL